MRGGLTPWHLRWLCEMSYLDLPGAGLCRRGCTLGKLAREMLDMDAAGKLPCGRLNEEERRTLMIVMDTPPLAGLVLADFAMDNGRTGFVAYALRMEEGAALCVFRGSERRGCGVPSNVDWADNFLAPFQGSVQYGEAAAFVRRNAGAYTLLTGHSKGAHNALYALTALEGGNAEAQVFNGQGFAPQQLTRDEKARLNERGTNYVVSGDVVGVLLYHPERRVFVRRQGEGYAHELSSFTFDAQGQPMPGWRPLWSLAVEWATRWYVRRAGERREPSANPT